MDDEFEDVDASLICEIVNSWTFMMFWNILPLEYFTAGLFLYCSMIFIMLTCLL